MRRRGFIHGIAACAAWPLAARAQQAAGPRRVGMLLNLSENDPEAHRLTTAFHEGLAQLGWADGRNLRIDYRWAGGDVGRIRAFAKELVELSASLAHPGGNITGFAVFEISLGAKWLEALKQIAPDLKRVTTIFNPETAPYYRLYLRAIETAAASGALEPMVAEVHDDTEIEAKISDLARTSNSGLIAMPDTFNLIHRHTIISLANRYRLPAIYYFPLFTTDGGLISYGPDEIDMFRRSAGYVDRILRGERAGDVPVQQPTNYRLVINLKTAKALSIEIPTSLLTRADEVIE